MTDKVWVAYVNSDLIEGRGGQVPIAVCKLKATAVRLGKGRNVQGSNAEVASAELVIIDGMAHIPICCVDVEGPTKQDRDVQAALDAREAAIATALKAGLTMEDIKALGVKSI